MKRLSAEGNVNRELTSVENTEFIVGIISQSVLRCGWGTVYDVVLPKGNGK